jgi:hypothetical protein
MSRIVPDEELDLIERVILEHPEGIGTSAIERGLSHHSPKALNRRTLQRRLKRLLADKRIKTEGKNRPGLQVQTRCRHHRRTSPPGVFN